MSDEGATESSELAPRDAGGDSEPSHELQRAVVNAAAVLRTLAENQRALRETVDRAERTELLLRNVQGLNETFRSISSTQAKLLEEVESARRSRGVRPLDWLLGVAIVGAVVVAYFGIAAALRDAGDQRTRDRSDNVSMLATAMKEGLAHREQLDAKLAQSTRRIEELEKSIAGGDTEKQGMAAALQSARAELEDARKRLEASDRELRALSQRISDGESSFASLVAKLDDSKKPVQEPAASEPASKPASRPSILPPTRIAEELNALLAFASKTELRFLELGATADAELHDACLTRYDEKGRPRGLVFARRARLEEASIEPRLTLVLRDGYDLTGTTKVPFATRTIELAGVDPNAWRRRLPDLLATSDASSPAMPATLAASAGATASAPAVPPDPRLPQVIDRVNRLLAAHSDYGRYRLESLVGIDGDALVGPAFVSLSSTSDGRHLQARRATLTYLAADRRLEIELEDGTRGRERPVPFPGGRLRLLFPGVDPAEFDGGDPPIPVRKR